MENATLHLASGEPTGLSVRHFRVEEALSSLFSIRVRAVSPDTSLDLGRLVGHDVTSGLIARKRFDFVNFTGSVEGGRAIERAAAGTFTPVTLELGGKDPAYVIEDAELDAQAGSG